MRRAPPPVARTSALLALGLLCACGAGNRAPQEAFDAASTPADGRIDADTSACQPAADSAEDLVVTVVFDVELPGQQAFGYYHPGVFREGDELVVVAARGLHRYTSSGTFIASVSFPPSPASPAQTVSVGKILAGEAGRFAAVTSFAPSDVRFCLIPTMSALDPSTCTRLGQVSAAIPLRTTSHYRALGRSGTSIREFVFDLDGVLVGEDEFFAFPEQPSFRTAQSSNDEVVVIVYESNSENGCGTVVAYQRVDSNGPVIPHVLIPPTMTAGDFGASAADPLAIALVFEALCAEPHACRSGRAGRFFVRHEVGSSSFTPVPVALGEYVIVKMARDGEAWAVAYSTGEIGVVRLADDGERLSYAVLPLSYQDPYIDLESLEAFAVLGERDYAVVYGRAGGTWLARVRLEPASATPP
jgi:hypothetical protein